MTSKAEDVCFSFAITDISHCLGRRPGEGTLTVSSLVRVTAPCCSQLPQCGTLQLWSHLGRSCPLCHVPLPSMCHLGSPLAGALLNAKHLQKGFANSWLKVLSFCDLIQNLWIGGGWWG